MEEQKNQNPLRLVHVTRYVMPLREGGSLPALADADDGFSYVLKFKGAGQREKALIAELIGGELARRLGFKVPELVFANLDEAFGRSEGDEEIQDLLKSSQGLNLALHFLSRALTFDPGASQVDEYLASRIVWYDAWITNVDRTFRNTNLLIWNRELWLIDHGAAFLFHHSWDNWQKHALSPFAIIKDHVLLPRATELEKVDKEMKTLITPQLIEEVVDMLPDEWILAGRDTETAAEARGVYTAFLKLRLENSDLFVNEATMQGKHLFEYALIRLVPRVEREEFVNVGVVLCCKRQNFIACKIHLSEQKLLALDASADLSLFGCYLESFEKICAGEKMGNPIALQDAATRFRWLTAMRSSMLQTSRPHSGFSEDLDLTLAALYEAYVA